MDKYRNMEGPYNLAGCQKTVSESPRFVKIDRAIHETKTEIEFHESALQSRKAYLKELQNLRKQVTPEDEAKIEALRTAGLL